MKKIFIILLTILLIGCQSHKTVEEKSLSKDITLSFYYIQSCSECKLFKTKVIPLLEQTFNEQITINQYNLDDEGTESIYDSTIDQLEEFDYEYYGMGPFIVVEGYFGKLGYTEGDEDYLIDDIINAVEGNELSDELGAFRFMYK